MTTTRSTTFTTTMWVVYRVHRNTANCRTNTSPARSTSFTQLRRACSQLPTSPRVARQSDSTLRISPERRRSVAVSTITSNQLSRCTRRTCDLTHLYQASAQRVTTLPTGMLRSGIELPALIGAHPPEMHLITSFN